MLTCIYILGGISIKDSDDPIEKIIKLVVHEPDTVGDVLLKIQEQEGIPTETKLLEFEGNQLIKSRILVSYYKIQDDSILYLKGKKI